MSDKKPNPIELGNSTVLELKNEIHNLEQKYLKEQQEYNKTGIKPIKKALKGDVFDKSNVGVDKRQAKDQVVYEKEWDDEERLKNVRDKLESKTKLYEKMIQEGKEFDFEDETQLIDFEKKKWELENEQKQNDKEVISEEEEWVEYTDEFGRNRIVQKSELPKKEWHGPELLSKDMQMELDRIEWEKRMMEENSKDELHYDNEKELRNLGVGFYKFSKDEDERRLQIEELKALRKETERNRRLHTTIQTQKQMKIKLRMDKVMKLRNKRIQDINNQSKNAGLSEKKVLDFLNKI